MADEKPLRASASVPGILALAAWTIYILINALRLPDVFPSVLVASAFGLLACVAVLVNFRHWRLALLLAAAAYVVIYLVRVGGMLMIGADAGQSSILSGLSFYYSMLWQVTAGSFQEKGTPAGLAQVYLEYVMPVLIVASIITTLLWRKRGA